MAIQILKGLTRRDFLKFSTLASAGLIIDFRIGRDYSLQSQIEQTTTGLLGRVFKDGTATYSEPSAAAQQLALHNRNDVLNLNDAVVLKNYNEAHELWYRIDDGGFINSHDIQPVRHQLNAPQNEIPTTGLLAQVTVPFTDAWNSSINGKKSNQVFFYGSTHWIFGLGQDEQKNIYYLVKEDRWNYSYYVNATHMRILQEEELQPISELVPLDKKQILIDLQTQVMTAFEKNEPVFMSELASGQLKGNLDLTTPAGEYIINYKRPSRHMAHSDRTGADGDELFGVPWVSYFTDTGIAFHGTYWHNTFTQPRSHGCINLPIDAALWVYRWTQPVVPPREQKFVSRYGTKIEVI